MFLFNENKKHFNETYVYELKSIFDEQFLLFLKYKERLKNLEEHEDYPVDVSAIKDSYSSIIETIRGIKKIIDDNLYKIILYTSLITNLNKKILSLVEKYISICLYEQKLKIEGKVEKNDFIFSMNEKLKLDIEKTILNSKKEYSKEYESLLKPSVLDLEAEIKVLNNIFHEKE